ncbi:MAG: DinB family protein [Acidobacteriota bacterium]|nr:DinB family protein [Acidobacteriota bacterium]
MTIADSFLPEFEQEMTTTRTMLARVPDGKGDWRPHPKSFPLAHLAQLVARMPGWITNVVQETSLDLAQGAAYSTETTPTLLALFDKNVQDARQALAATADDAFAIEWSLQMGAKTLFTDSRRNVVRQTINHLVHHRGQLSVYLRLLDVPVPSIYGPTADEGWQ